MTSESRQPPGSHLLAIAVVVLIYQEHTPAALDVPGVKTGLGYALAFLGALLAGRLLKIGTQRTRALHRGMVRWFRRLAKGFKVTWTFRSGENDSGVPVRDSGDRP